MPRTPCQEPRLSRNLKLASAYKAVLLLILRIWWKEASQAKGLTIWLWTRLVFLKLTRHRRSTLAMMKLLLLFARSRQAVGMSPILSTGDGMCARLQYEYSERHRHTGLPLSESKRKPEECPHALPPRYNAPNRNFPKHHRSHPRWSEED